MTYLNICCNPLDDVHDALLIHRAGLDVELHQCIDIEEALQQISAS